MRKMKWVVICVVALIALCLLLAGCQKGSDDTLPSEDPATESPSESPPPPPPSPSDVPDSPPPSDEPTPPDVPTSPDRTPDPLLNWEYIDFPNIDGFDKIVVDVEAMAVYNGKNGMVNIIMQYISATQTQLDELAEGGGESLDALFAEVIGESADITSSGLIELPGLDREGLEVEFMLNNVWYCRGVFIPSEGQILAVFGMSMPADKEELMDGYNKLLGLLESTI